MRLICPSCAATASAEAWQNDAEARGALVAMARLPRPVAEQVLPYLAVFRPAKRALSWKRARKLLEELAAMVATEGISVDRKPPRPCPPAIWGHAMHAVRERLEAGKLDTPLPNHNYLRQVAYGMADKADAAREQAREDANQRPAAHRPVNEPEPTEAEIAALREKTRRDLGIEP